MPGRLCLTKKKNFGKKGNMQVEMESSTIWGKNGQTHHKLIVIDCKPVIFSSMGITDEKLKSLPNPSDGIKNLNNGSDNGDDAIERRFGTSASMAASKVGKSYFKFNPYDPEYASDDDSSNGRGQADKHAPMLFELGTGRHLC